jgi:hypothetical protein
MSRAGLKSAGPTFGQANGVRDLDDVVLPPSANKLCVKNSREPKISYFVNRSCCKLASNVIIPVFRNCVLCPYEPFLYLPLIVVLWQVPLAYRPRYACTVRHMVGLQPLDC